MKSYQELYDISSSLNLLLSSFPENGLTSRVKNLKSFCEEELKKEKFEYCFLKTKSYGKQSLKNLVSSNEEMEYIMFLFDEYKNKIDNITYPRESNGNVNRESFIK